MRQMGYTNKVTNIIGKDHHGRLEGLERASQKENIQTK